MAHALARPASGSGSGSGSDDGDGPDGADPRLTPRQQEVARLVGQGLANADIARTLTISRRTVESHVDHIKRTLGLQTRHELIAWSLRMQVQDP